MRFGSAGKGFSGSITTSLPAIQSCGRRRRPSSRDATTASSTASAVAIDAVWTCGSRLSRLGARWIIDAAATALGGTIGIDPCASTNRANWFAESNITLAKEATLANRRLAFDRTRDRDVVSKLFNELGPRYNARPGGYTRILKMGFRVGDNAPLAFVELVDRPETASTDAPAAGATE